MRRAYVPVKRGRFANISHDKSEEEAIRLKAVATAAQSENGGLFADGVAIFNEQAGDVDAATVPVHAVIYRGFVNLWLMDESGGAGDIDVPWSPPAAGDSIEFDGTVWGGRARPARAAETSSPFPRRRRPC